MPLFVSKKKKNKETNNNSVTSIKNHMMKANNFLKNKSMRNAITDPEFDFNLINMVYKSDSYLKIAINKYSQMLFKAGYILKSDNPKALEYIKTRFRIMSFVTKKDMDILFDELGSDLVKYSNAFLIKGRVKEIMPGVDATGFLEKDPIGGYYRQNPARIQIKRDSSGNISHYIVNNDADTTEYKANDVIHFYLDKESDNDFGTPRAISALEDIDLLRKIEGNVAVMIYRYSMPMYHWKVGLPETGYQATSKEIDEAVDYINNMPLDGTIVTNEKTNVSIVGAQGSALNAVEYLHYFEKRAFTALDVSESQMGRGGAKQDADSMEAQAHDTVKHIQKIFALFAENCIINEILLEGNFNPIVNEKDRVEFKFNEINIETKIKVENHEMAKYQSNVITFPEMRRNIGEHEKANKEDLYKFYIENDATTRETDIKTKASIEIADAAHKNAVKLAKINQANTENSNSTSSPQGNKKVSPNGNGTAKKQSASKDVDNKNAPENQHGKTSVKVKESFNDLEIHRGLEESEEVFIDIYEEYSKIMLDYQNNNEVDKDVLLSVGFDNLKMLLTRELQVYSHRGINKALEEIKSMSKTFEQQNISVYLKDFEKDIEDNIKDILLNIQDRINENNDSNIDIVFRLYKYRIRFMLEDILPKAYWYSYLITARTYGYEKARVLFGDSDDSKEHKELVDIQNFALEDIPPFHAFCDCKMRILMKGD